ncbi:unnamed protein product [Timema podura]|uniref:Uncharacterized protein n=1 Tax=Timema podura TaxID=61482 RepID=A0ABN7NZJ0_TIMPD|nr:unnamed protein product [Timema podura]
MARNVRAVTSGLGMAHQHSSSNVIGSRTTVACMGIKMAAAAILFLPHLWLSGCLGGRFPEPYYHLDNRHSENYDPRFWLTPYEYPIDAYYYPEDYVDMNYSSNDGYPQDPYLTSTPNRDSNPEITVISSLVYCESDALHQATTEAGFQSITRV